MSWPPFHARRGLLRLYILLVVPWVGILGYIAYDAHGTYLTFTRYVAGHVRSHENIPITQLGADYFTTMRISAQAGDAARQRRDNALIALPVIPIGLPLLWLAFLWVSAGFRQS